MGFQPMGSQESDMTERLNHRHHWLPLKIYWIACHAHESWHGLGQVAEILLLKFSQVHFEFFLFWRERSSQNSFLRNCLILSFEIEICNAFLQKGNEVIK